MLVQCGQRVASSGILLLQNGQVFSVGAAGSSFPWNRRFITFTIRNTTNAMMIKFSTPDKNIPKFTVAVPDAYACANVS